MDAESINAVPSVIERDSPNPRRAAFEVPRHCPPLSRRRFLQRSSIAVASSSLAVHWPFVVTGQAAPDGPIRLGVIGCGARGLGAASEALRAAANVRVVALADVFLDRLSRAREELAKASQLIADDHCFAGFDGYQRLLALPEVNYVVHATPPGFRPGHLRAIVEAGKHCLLEMPVAVDPPGVRSVIESGELARWKKLSLGVGTQRRHQDNYKETVKRLQAGAPGEILAGRAYAEVQGEGQLTKPANLSDMEWQLRHWPYYAWLSGDPYVAQHVHNLDVLNWILRAHPVRASGMGGRQVRTLGQVYDHFAVEYQYADGACLFSYTRQTDGCEDDVSETVVGTQGTSDCCQWIETRSGAAWKFPKQTTAPAAARGDGGTNNGYVQMHADLIRAIRTGQSLNEAGMGADSTLTAIMGREAAYTGQPVEWDRILNARLDLTPPRIEMGDVPVPAVPLPGSKHASWSEPARRGTRRTGPLETPAVWPPRAF